MKKFIYIANIRLPTEKAHGIQIMKMCEAFANQGLEVELVVPRRINPIKDDPFKYYSVQKNFKIKKLPSIDLVRFGKIGFWTQYLSFTETASWYSLFKKNALFYTRDELVAYYLSNLGKRITWEGHGGEENWFVRQLIKRKMPTVLISKGLEKLYKSLNADTKKILIAPDAVDIKQFSLAISQNDAREKVGLPLEKKIILYTGHLYSWKGADMMADVAQNISEDVLFVFVGGTSRDIETFKDQHGSTKNILILGKKPHHEIPFYLRAADILLLPNSAKEDISRLYTSPMKLFEYMASGTPIIASNLPSIREILDDSMVYFFESDNSKILVETIKKVLSDYEKAKHKAQVALLEVKNYSWEKRARSIFEFVNHEYSEKNL